MLQGYAGRAAEAANRYGTARYNALKQFINSPGGQQTISSGVELLSGGNLGPNSGGSEARIVANAPKGKAGEILSDIVKNTERSESLSGTAKYRIPDILNHTNMVGGMWRL